jgi:hypothetical protein
LAFDCGRNYRLAVAGKIYRQRRRMDGYSDRRDNRLDVEAGPFVAGKVSIRF